MTRAKVLQLGLFVLVLGPVAYGFFRLLGLDGEFAGISAQLFLLLILVGWTGSYLFRVVTGKMTFLEQRRRYLTQYEELNSAGLLAKFNEMSEAEQIRLMHELEIEDKKKSSDSISDK